MDDRQGNEGYRDLACTFNVESSGAQGGGAEPGGTFWGQIMVVHLV